MFQCKCPSLHTLGNTPPHPPHPSLCVPRTHNISSVSITLLISQSSSYTSMSLYIDLIEHIVDKVLRNPLGVFLFSSQQSLLTFLKSIHHFRTFSFCSFLHSISVSLLPLQFLSLYTPSAALLPLYSFSLPPVSHPLFPFNLNALPNIDPSSNVMDS